MCLELVSNERLSVLCEDEVALERTIESIEVGELGDVARFVSDGPSRTERLGWLLLDARRAAEPRVGKFLRFLGQLFIWPFRLAGEYYGAVIATLAVATLWGLRLTAADGYLIVFGCLVLVVSFVSWATTEESAAAKAFVLFPWLFAAGFVNFGFTLASGTENSFLCMARDGQTRCIAGPGGSIIRANQKITRIPAERYTANDVVNITGASPAIMFSLTSEVGYELGLVSDDYVDLPGGDPRAEFERVRREISRVVEGVTATDVVDSPPPDDAYQKAIDTVASPLFQVVNLEIHKAVEILNSPPSS